MYWSSDLFLRVYSPLPKKPCTTWAPDCAFVTRPPVQVFRPLSSPLRPNTTWYSRCTNAVTLGFWSRGCPLVYVPGLIPYRAHRFLSLIHIYIRKYRRRPNR